MLCSGGGCDSDIAAKCCVALGKLRKLLPGLTSRHLSPKVCGKVYTTRVCSVMFHSSKTWGLNTSDLEQLHHNDRAMIRWIYGTKDQDEPSSISLLQKLCIKNITAVLCSGWLRWCMYSVPRPVSKLSPTFLFLSPEGKGGLERYCLNVSILLSVNVSWLALTHRTEILGEPVFGIVWCCLPHWMGHEQHPNLKMDMDVVVVVVVVVVDVVVVDVLGVVVMVVAAAVIFITYWRD